MKEFPTVEKINNIESLETGKIDLSEVGFSFCGFRMTIPAMLMY